MKLNEFLKKQELAELGPIAPQQQQGVQTTPAVSQQFDPKIQTALVAQQQQNKIKQRKSIQDQITALTKQISDLRKQLSDIG